MGSKTIEFNQEMAKKYNVMMDNPNLFSSTGSTDEQTKRDELITSIVNTRQSISNSMNKFKNYYSSVRGNDEWQNFNKNPKTFDTPIFLVTGIPPNPLENPNIDTLLNDLETSDDAKGYHVAPTFYKNLYNIYLKNANSSVAYYAKISEIIPKIDIPNMEELYKILGIDLDTQIQEKKNTSDVNKRKTYYETLETDKMKTVIIALRTLYIRIFLILIFIKLYVYFLKEPISIKGVFIELITLTFLFVFPILLAVNIITFIPKYLFEYLPVNVWVKNMK